MGKVDTGAYSPTASGDATDGVANGVTAAADSAKPLTMNGRGAGSKAASTGGRCVAATEWSGRGQGRVSAGQD